MSAKDKEIDDLLEKLGETKDQAEPEEQRPGALAPENTARWTLRPGRADGRSPRTNRSAGVAGAR